MLGPRCGDGTAGPVGAGSGVGVVVFQWGNGSRLPGGTVYRWPVGLVHSMVPSASWWSVQPLGPV